MLRRSTKETVAAWAAVLSAKDREELIAQAHRDAQEIREANTVPMSQKLGKHFHNPAVMRQHERDAEVGEKNRPGDGEDGGHGGIHEVRQLLPDHPENPSPGKHHVIARHADGHEEHTDHDSVDEAQAHMQSLNESEANGDGSGQSDGNSEEEICPECGASMVEGRCEECGYEKGAQEMAGHGGDQESDEDGGY